jgi:hypothetical protein
MFCECVLFQDYVTAPAQLMNANSKLDPRPQRWRDLRTQTGEAMCVRYASPPPTAAGMAIEQVGRGPASAGDSPVISAA